MKAKILKLIAALLVFVPFVGAEKVAVEPVGIEVNVTRVPNGCLISALQVQIALLAQKELSGVTWARIVCVGYYNGTGHAYCVFALRNGDIWAYDPQTNSSNLHTKNQEISVVLFALKLHDPSIKNGNFLDNE